MKNLLEIKNMSVNDIHDVLNLASAMKKSWLDGKRRNDLEGKRVMPLFFDNNANEKSSFCIAAKALGAEISEFDCLSVSPISGSALIDTATTLDALGTDIVVIRHTASGAPLILSRNIKASVINAGDGANEDPTSALAGFFTMREEFGWISGLKVTIAGDIKHSGVAKSNLWGLKTLGADVTVCAPKTMLPVGFENECRVTTNLKEAVTDADVVIALPVKAELQAQGLIPSVKEYNACWGITDELMSYASPHAIVLCGGMGNKGTESVTAVCGSDKSRIDAEITNGVAVRMAVLTMIGRGE